MAKKLENSNLIGRQEKDLDNSVQIKRLVAQLSAHTLHRRGGCKSLMGTVQHQMRLVMGQDRSARTLVADKEFPLLLGEG
jgi:hypothetical protein